MPSNSPKPTESHTALEGVDVCLYGKPFTLPLPGVFTEGEHEAHIENVEMLRLIAQDAGVADLYIPRVDHHNGQIARPDAFTSTAPLGELTVYTGPPVDGVVIPQSAAALLHSADCHIVVAMNNETEEIIAAHAGRQCVVDHAYVRTGERSRRFDSVIDEIMAALDPSSPRSVSAHILCGIAGPSFDHPFDHSTYGEFNKRLVSYIAEQWKDWQREPLFVGEREQGCIDIPAVITAQFSKHGVRDVTADTIDTATDERWYSHRRGDAGRNGVLVVPRD